MCSGDMPQGFFLNDVILSPKIVSTQRDLILTEKGLPRMSKPFGK